MIYVVSDIHGYFSKFIELLDKINFTEKDKLFILGDVIDRGPEPIKLLQFIMSKSNMYMTLGNHEDMMLAYYEKPIGYSKALWFANGGEVTEKAFKLCSKEEQQEITGYLQNLPIEYNLEIDNKKFNLVHGNYVSEEEREHLSDVLLQDRILWGRVPQNSYGPKDYTVIFGHTCTLHYKENQKKCSIWKQGNLIGIDCGMASYTLYPNVMRLGCICLNSSKVFYV